MSRSVASSAFTLAIDVGNTNVAVGAFRGEELCNSWRLHTDREKTADEYGVVIENLLRQVGLELKQVSAAAVCSVVPPLTSQFVDLCWQLFGLEPWLLRPETQRLVHIEYENPADVGADRIANALALRELYGAPGIVVDFGTATTVDVVSSRGTYLGGAIAPGILTSLDALFYRAARLPRVELTEPPRAIGRNTLESIQSGTVFGYAGMVEGLVTRFKAELQEKPVVVATGGLAPLVCGSMDCIDDIDPHLTLKGLIIFARACSSARPSGQRSKTQRRQRR